MWQRAPGTYYICRMRCFISFFSTTEPRNKRKCYTFMLYVVGLFWMRLISITPTTRNWRFTNCMVYILYVARPMMVRLMSVMFMPIARVYVCVCGLDWIGGFGISSSLKGRFHASSYMRDPCINSRSGGGKYVSLGFNVSITPPLSTHTTRPPACLSPDRPTDIGNSPMMFSAQIPINICGHFILHFN